MDMGDLKETAALARLNMNETELAAAFPAFEQMLGFFAAMQAADADTEAFPGGASRFAAPGAAPDFFRPDIPGAFPRSHNQESLLDNAGERDGRFIVVPNVL
jgi:aspartyl-tRNA(Asn)/glutamyl-tRNA(Gln) amidotransferase subunit C